MYEASIERSIDALKDRERSPPDSGTSAMRISAAQEFSRQ